MALGAGGNRHGAGTQRWATVVRIHAQTLVPSDFSRGGDRVIPVALRLQGVEIGSGRLVRVNATRHPTATWALQQLREVLAMPPAYRFALHDRDSIYLPRLDVADTAMGVRILRTSVRAPKANAVCERLLGSLRRECLDFLISLSEEHLRQMLRA